MDFEIDTSNHTDDLELWSVCQSTLEEYWAHNQEDPAVKNLLGRVALRVLSAEELQASMKQALFPEHEYDVSHLLDLHDRHSRIQMTAEQFDGYQDLVADRSAPLTGWKCETYPVQIGSLPLLCIDMEGGFRARIFLCLTAEDHDQLTGTSNVPETAQDAPAQSNIPETDQGAPAHAHESPQAPQIPSRDALRADLLSRGWKLDGDSNVERYELCIGTRMVHITLLEKIAIFRVGDVFAEYRVCSEASMYYGQMPYTQVVDRLLKSHDCLVPV